MPEARARSSRAWIRIPGAEGCAPVLRLFQVAMVELQINEPTQVPEWLFVLFAVCTTVLVAVHIFALMISTYLLPNIDAISKLQVRAGVQCYEKKIRRRGAGAGL